MSAIAFKVRGLDLPDKPLLDIKKKAHDKPERNSRYFVAIIENNSTGTLCWNRCVKILTGVFNFNSEQASATCSALNNSGKEVLAEYDTEEEADRIALAATAGYHDNPCCRFHSSCYPFVYGKL